MKGHLMDIGPILIQYIRWTVSTLYSMKGRIVKNLVLIVVYGRILELDECKLHSCSSSDPIEYLGPRGVHGSGLFGF